MDLGNGLGLWKTIPIFLLISTKSASFAVISTSPLVIFPSYLQIGIKSFILLIVRRRVLFPQPEGPISAVTLFFAIGKETPYRACLFPYHKSKSSIIRSTSPSISSFLVESGTTSPPISSLMSSTSF